MIIKRVFIANRGEIARRIIASAQIAGIETICIASPADLAAPHLAEATIVVPLIDEGAAPYLDIPFLIETALTHKADALHPGYGFLSESHTFARAVIAAGLTWIGPHPDAIEQMGDKGELKNLLVRLNLPTIPGSRANLTANVEENRQIAASVGYPLLMKIATGGGGKGILVVEKEKDFVQLYREITEINRNFFGNSTILFERKIEHPRHIEVQVAGDGVDLIHLFDRNCSFQRKNQKSIEEAPATGISQTTRTQMFEAALSLCRALSYTNVGTVEFLVDRDEKFYILEVNTRLQVEHTITEYITGIDLVLLQFTLAAGQKLPYRQSDITARGHAFECRISAEQPEQDFLPATGTIVHYGSVPGIPNVRFDESLAAGMSITHHFDPMIGKVIAGGFTRDEARRRMILALERLEITGITTNKAFLKEALDSPLMIEGTYSTRIAYELIASPPSRPATHDTDQLTQLLALAYGLTGEKKRAALSLRSPSQWKDLRWTK